MTPGPLPFARVTTTSAWWKGDDWTDEERRRIADDMTKMWAGVTSLSVAAGGFALSIAPACANIVNGLQMLHADVRLHHERIRALNAANLQAALESSDALSNDIEAQLSVARVHGARIEAEAQILRERTGRGGATT